MSQVPDNEQVYDELIAPVVSFLIAVCKRYRMPMAMTFEYAPELFCSTYTCVDRSGREMLVQAFAELIDEQVAANENHDGNGVPITRGGDGA